MARHRRQQKPKAIGEGRVLDDEFRKKRIAETAGKKAGHTHSLPDTCDFDGSNYAGRIDTISEPAAVNYRPDAAGGSQDTAQEQRKPRSAA